MKLKSTLLAALFLTLTSGVFAQNTNSAIALPLANQYVRFNAPNYGYTNEITVEFWVNYQLPLTNVWAGQGAFDDATFATNSWYFFDNAFYVADGVVWRFITYPAVTDTGWHHIAGVAGPNGMQVFIDGVQVVSNPSLIPNVINSPASPNVAIT